MYKLLVHLWRRLLYISYLPNYLYLSQEKDRNINPKLKPLHDRHWRRSVATLATRRVPLLEQELLTFTGHLSSLPVFSGVRVAQSLVFCVVYCG